MLRRIRRRLGGVGPVPEPPRPPAPPTIAPAPTTSPARWTPPSAGAKPPLFFHVGAAKTGTTYLQRLLFANREQLAAAGVLYPGDHFGAHVQAAFDLRGTGFDGPDPHAEGRWRAFVDAARDWNGPVVFSQELFSPADPRQIATALADLSFADVHIVLTARELSRQIPAAWQEDVKNRFTTSFDEFVRQVREPRRLASRQGRMFWELQDCVDVLQRWARDVPPERVHVVTVPPPGGPRDVLWRRFASVVGIEPGFVDAAAAFQNSSLGLVETTVLRRLNLALDDEVGWPLYNELVKHYLAQDVLVDRAGSSPIRLSEDDRVWAAERARAQAEGLAAAGYDVVGSLRDLLPPDPPPQASSDGSPEASVEAQLEVALEAMAALLLRISRLRRGIR